MAIATTHLPRSRRSQGALLVAALAALAGFASPAAAQAAPHRLETSHIAECGAVEITLRNVSPWIYPMSVEVDGVHSYGPVVDNRVVVDGIPRLSGPQQDQSATRRIEFAEDFSGGEVLVRYRVQAGSERDLYVGLPAGEWVEVVVDTDCAPPRQEFDACPAELGSVHATNLDANGWTIEGAGAATYVDGAIDVEVPGSWQSTRIVRQVNLPLAAMGAVVDFTAAPAQYVGIHMNIAGGGRLVYEQEPSYEGRWWLTPSSPDYLKDGIQAHPGGGGSPHDAEPEAWLGAFPDLVIESIEVLYTHPAASTTRLSSATFGCTVHTFGLATAATPPPPPAAPQTPTPSTGSEPSETVEPQLPAGDDAEVGGIDDEASAGGAGADADGPARVGTLPRTGAGVGVLAAAAAVVLVVGLSLRSASRRLS